MKRFEEEGYATLVIGGDVWSAAALLESHGFRVLSFRVQRKDGSTVHFRGGQKTPNKPEGDSDAE